MSDNLTQKPIMGGRVGQRIREAREALGMGQETLAQRVGISRPALSAAEHGKREVSAAELLEFSDALSRPLDYFLRQREAAPFDFQPLLRVAPVTAAPERPIQRGGRASGTDARTAVRQALVAFEELCRMYLELEELSGLAVPPLPAYHLAPGRYMYREAERLAELIRTKLGLGSTLPATQLRELLETRLAIKTFVLRSSGKLSGACIYHERVGGCVLVVLKTIPHMLFTLAHELAHLLVHRDAPVVDEDLFAKTPKEQFANAFAAALLMPREGVQERFWGLYRSRSDFTDIDVIHIARHFGTSFDATLSRLEGLRLLVPGSRATLLDAYRAARTGPGKRAAQAGLEPPTDSFWEPLPERYAFLAVRAYRREEMSIGRLAEVLRHVDGRPRSIEEAQLFVENYQAPPNGDEAGGSIPSA